MRFINLVFNAFVIAVILVSQGAFSAVETVRMDNITDLTVSSNGAYSAAGSTAGSTNLGGKKPVGGAGPLLIGAGVGAIANGFQVDADAKKQAAREKAEAQALGQNAVIAGGASGGATSNSIPESATTTANAATPSSTTAIPGADFGANVAAAIGANSGSIKDVVDAVKDAAKTGDAAINNTNPIGDYLVNFQRGSYSRVVNDMVQRYGSLAAAKAAVQAYCDKVHAAINGKLYGYENFGKTDFGANYKAGDTGLTCQSPGGYYSASASIRFTPLTQTEKEALSTTIADSKTETDSKVNDETLTVPPSTMTETNSWLEKLINSLSGVGTAVSSLTNALTQTMPLTEVAKTETMSEFCSKNKNVLMCQEGLKDEKGIDAEIDNEEDEANEKTDELKNQILENGQEISQKWKDFTYENILGIADGGGSACPAPITVSFYSKQLVIKYDWVCNVLSKSRAVIIGLFAFASMVLVMKGLR